jgi:hypothetical protein
MPNYTNQMHTSIKLQMYLKALVLQMAQVTHFLRNYVFFFLMVFNE